MYCQCFILSMWKFCLAWKVCYPLSSETGRETYGHTFLLWSKLSLLEFWLLPSVYSCCPQVSADPIYHNLSCWFFFWWWWWWVFFVVVFIYFFKQTHKYLGAEELERWLNYDTQINIAEVIIFHIEIKTVHSTLPLGQCAHAQLQKITWQVVTC